MARCSTIHRPPARCHHRSAPCMTVKPKDQNVRPAARYHAAAVHRSEPPWLEAFPASAGEVGGGAGGAGGAGSGPPPPQPPALACMPPEKPAGVAQVNAPSRRRPAEQLEWCNRSLAAGRLLEEPCTSLALVDPVLQQARR